MPDPDTAVRRVTGHFRSLTGRSPDGVWAAPGRVNLIGEHVDYNGGLCPQFALPYRTLVALSPRSDDRIRLTSAQIRPVPDARGATRAATWRGSLGEIAPGRSPGWVGYAAGVAWGLRRLGFDVPGFDAVVDGHVPLGSGLSSSAALECAVAVALDEVAGLGADPSQLAEACIAAENEIAGAPTGGMDQTAALRCRAGHALLLDTRDGSVEHLSLDLAAAGTELLVIDTRARHSLVDGQYGSRRAMCEQAARILGVTTLREVDDLAAALDRLPHDEMRRRVRHVVTEIERVRRTADLLSSRRLGELGPLLDASHASLRDDYEVSCPELDLGCSVAREAGASGARMTGGGFGGSAIALVETGRTEAVAGAVTAAFAARDWAAPAFLRAVPSDPAGRVR